MDGEVAKSDQLWSKTAVVWSSRHLRAAAAFGFVTAILGQILVTAFGEPSADPDASSPFVVGAVAAIVTAAEYALVALVGAGMTLPLLRSKLARGVGVHLGPTLVAILFGYHVIALVVRAQTGFYPTPDAFAMARASPNQFLNAALVGYRGPLITLGVSAVASILLLGLYLRRVADTIADKELRAKPWDGLLLLCALLFPLGTGLSGASLLAQVSEATPALSLLTFFEDPSMEDAPLGDEDAEPKEDEPKDPSIKLAKTGPRIKAAEEWKQALRGSNGPRPNVLLLMIESVPIDHVGHAGYERPVTPNLDRIAKDSLQLTHTWATSTHSNYAQMAVLSSLHPRRMSRLHYYKNTQYPRVLLHDVMSALGYDTATISSQNEEWGGMRNFQTTDTPTHFFHSLDHPGPHIGTGKERKLPDHLTVDEVQKWLDQRSDKPWSLYVNFQRTHFPYALPEGFEGKYEPAEPAESSFGYLRWPRKEKDVVINRYDNALMYVDEQIGRLRDYLEKTGQLHNTIWIITSDHGEFFYEHQQVTHGKTLFETTARVLLYLHWPGKIEPATLDRPVSHLDVLPTLADLLDVPPHPSFQGRSFLAEDAKLQKPGIFMSIQSFNHADAVVCWPWKLVINKRRKRDDWIALYHLAADPEERRNLAGSRQEVSEPLQALVTDFIRAQVRFHHTWFKDRGKRFAPRLQTCPELPAD
jgi:arylsulfatase A-like enzyme